MSYSIYSLSGGLLVCNLYDRNITDQFPVRVLILRYYSGTDVDDIRWVAMITDNALFAGWAENFPQNFHFSIAGTAHTFI